MCTASVAATCASCVWALLLLLLLLLCCMFNYDCGGCGRLGCRCSIERACDQVLHAEIRHWGRHSWFCVLF